jgi:hypothetical protein
MAKSEALITIRTETGNSDANLKKLDKEINNVKKSAKGTNQGLSETSDVLGQMGGPLGSAAGGIKSLGTAFKALLASPIGIVLGLIAGIVALLSRLDPVVDKVEQGLDALTAIFDTLAGNLAKVGKLMMQLTMFDLSGATKTAQELGSAMGEAANEAIDLRKSIQALEDVENDYTVSTAKAEASVKNLLIQAKNVNLSYKEKIKILNEASRIEKEDFENGLKIAQEKARIAKGELARIDKAGVDRGKAAQEAAQAEANLIRVQGQSADLQEKIQNRIDLVNQAAEEQRKKIEEERKKREEERLAAEAKLNEERLVQLRKSQSAYEDFLTGGEKARQEAIQKEIDDLLFLNSQKESLSEDEANKLLARRKLTEEEIATIAGLSVEKQIAFIKKLADEENAVEKAKLNARIENAQQIAGLLKDISTLVGEQSEEAKAVAAAGTLINTYVAAMTAYTQGLKVGPIFAALSAAVATATGLKAVQNILNTDAKGGSVNVGNTQVAAPPPITRPSSSFVQLDNTNPLNVNNTGMTKVVVVESDITQVQSKVKSIKAKATIG